MRSPTLVLFTALIPLMIADPLSAQEQSDQARYGECMALARERPDKAFDQAGQWVDMGGGAPARHCEAVALMGLGEYAEAAHRLETLAEDPTGDRALRVNLLAQAAQGWLAAGDLSRADADQTTAIQLAASSPDQGVAPVPHLLPDLYVDRAVTLAQAGKDEEALRDLTQALILAPGKTEAFVLRSAARRRLGNLPGALTDVEQAISLAPSNPEAYLERGDVYLALKRFDDARADWVKVLDLDPRDPAADVARARIEELDVHVN
ncbi:MAG: tetratricopeptide repeat protein [Rhodospirillum sp.]|nr:tetratricopeptide repeat protein [Rhodospirillum sp.]MCF8487919.1 tetratricopeptide repeat protein [Rhodospirillum sp.]MCF8500680.1 tetratricopeptide repeat protein [Rhodospirillum sp.]